MLLFGITSRSAALSRAAFSRTALLSLFALGASVSPFTLDLPSGSLPRLASSIAKARENVAISRIEIPTANAGTFILSDIRVTGSSLTRAEFEALFQPESAKALTGRLARFDADTMSIGALEWRLDNEAIAITTRYERLEARDIRAGSIARIEIAGGKQLSVAKTGPHKDQDTSASFGRTTIDALNLAGTMRWLTDADPSGNAPMVALHGPYSIQSMEISGKDFSARTGLGSVSGFQARLARKPVLDIAAGFMTLAKSAEKPAPELGVGFLADLIDVYSSFEMGEGKVETMALAGKDARTGTAFAATAGPMTFSGGAKAGGRVEAIDMRLAEGFAKIGSSRFEGDGYALLFAGLAKAALAGEAAGKASPEEITRLEAALKGLALRDIAMGIDGLDVDLPPGEKDKGKERVKFTLAGFETRAGGFVGAVPTAIEMKLDRFRMPIPANTKDKGLRDLKEFGLAALDLTMGLHARYDEGKSTLALNDASVFLANLGKVALKAELGNVPKSFFENPQASWALALMGGTIRNARISIENNGGGLEKVIAKTAKDQKKSPEQFRVEIATMGPALIGAFMADHPDAGKLADALGTFLKSLGALDLAARSANGTGIGFADFAAAGGNPAAILAKLRFDVTAK
jgi:hypothetical protein